MTSSHPLRSAVQIIGTFGSGGAQRAAWNLAAALGAAGVRSFALALRKAGDFSELPAPGVRVIEIGGEADRPISRARTFLRLHRLLRRISPDLVHVHGQHSIRPVVMALAGMRPRPALWFTWHDSRIVVGERGEDDPRLRRALLRVDRLFGSSESVAERLGKALGAGAPPISAFPNAVPDAPPAPGREAEPPSLVWLGRLSPPKDPKALLEAAATLAREGSRFRATIAGVPPPGKESYRDELLARRSQLGLDDVVSLPGYTDSAALVQTGAIGVQTSRFEGLSMALLEQMMAGLAVVATDVGDTRRPVQDGETGLLIPPGDCAALTAALRRLLADPPLRRRLGDAAREQVRSTWSLPAVAAHVMDLYGAAAVRAGETR